MNSQNCTQNMNETTTRIPLYLSKPGVICAAGTDADSLFDSAVSGNQKGIKEVKALSGATFFAGRIDDSLLAPTDDTCDMRILRIENAALKQIAGDVEKAKQKYGADRIAVCVGSCDNGSELSLAAHRVYFAEGKFSSSYDLTEQGAQYPAEFASRVFGLRGPVLAFATACSSSAGAFVKASELIRAGFADAALVGGADVASDTVLLGFGSLGAVSPQKTNPFSKNRCGITLGEGAAFFMLTKDPLDSSVPCIQLLGTGESSDASHMTAPLADGSGAKSAMEEALKDASILPSEVDYVNMHGTGTPLNDSMEAKATAAVFGENGVKASTTKPLTGHTLGAAGAVELAVCWMTIARSCENEKNNKEKKASMLPVQVWDEVRDEELPLLDIVSAHSCKCEKQVRICMSNSFAFGGCNTSLVIGTKRLTRTSCRINKEQLLELLPHKGKMHLLDRIISYDLDKRIVTSEIDVTEQSFFYDEKIGGVPSYVSFEYIAQTISALSGIEGNVKGEPVKPGVLLSVNGYKCTVPFFAPGTKVRIEITETCTLDNVLTYDGKVFISTGTDSDPVITSQITVMEIEDMESLEKQV